MCQLHTQLCFFDQVWDFPQLTVVHKAHLVCLQIVHFFSGSELLRKRKIVYTIIAFITFYHSIFYLISCKHHIIIMLNICETSDCKWDLTTCWDLNVGDLAVWNYGKKQKFRNKTKFYLMWPENSLPEGHFVNFFTLGNNHMKTKFSQKSI